MAAVSIMTTMTSTLDYTFNVPTNPKIGDIVVMIDAYDIYDFPRDITANQTAIFHVLALLFDNSNLIQSGLEWVSSELYYNNNPIEINTESLRYAVSMGELILDPLTKQLSGVCYNKDALANAQESQLFKVFNLPFYASVFKSTNLRPDCIDAYDILKPYVPKIDSMLDQTHSRAIDDGTKITFFAEKYTRQEFIY